MPDPAAIPTGGSRFAFRLAAFYAALFAISGAYMPFFPVWLQGIGLAPTEIGLIVAIPAVARLLAVPTITSLAGRRDTLRGGIIATAVFTFLGFLLLGNMRTALAVGIVMYVLSWPWTAVTPLTDAYALRGTAWYRRAYGPIRLWGSVGYIGGTLVAGALVGFLGPQGGMWIIAALAGLCALSGFWLAPTGPAARGALQVAKPTALLRTPAFVAVVVGAALIQGSHSAYYTFSTISWQAAGMSSATVSMLWALCVIVEVVLFALSPRLDLSPATLIAIGGGGALLRWLIMAQEPSLAVLSLAQALHALSFGATHLGAMGLLARLVPGQFMANAQGYLATASSVVMASTGIACGAMFGALGQSIYFGMAAMALAGTIVVLLARRTIRAAMG